MIKNIYHPTHTGMTPKKERKLCFSKKFDPSGFTLSLSGNSNKQRVQFMHVSMVIATSHNFSRVIDLRSRPSDQPGKQRGRKSKFRWWRRLGPTRARAAAGYTPPLCMEEAAPSSTCSPEPPSCPGCTEAAPGSPPHPHRRP